MSLGDARVKDEPECVTDQAYIKGEEEWNNWAVCVKQEPAHNPGDCPLHDNADALFTATCARYCRRGALADHTYAKTGSPPADEWAELYAEHAVKDELVLGPECVQRPRVAAASRERFNPCESSTVGGRAEAVGARAEPAREPREKQLAMKKWPATHERVPHCGTRACARGSYCADTDGDSDIEHAIDTPVDYEKDPICDLCGRRFVLKSDLMKHVVLHIHIPTRAEQGGSGVVDDDDNHERYDEEPAVKWEVAGDDKWEVAGDEEPAVKWEVAGDDKWEVAGDEAGDDKWEVVGDAANDDKWEMVGDEASDDKWEVVGDAASDEMWEVAGDAVSDDCAALAPGGGARPEPARAREQLALACSVRVERLRGLEAPHASQACLATSRRGQKQFTHKSSLNRHIRTHTGDSPYSCEVYSKTFADSSALRKHQRIHTGDKHYTCNICDKRFTQKVHLIKHIRTHTGEISYTCDVCSKTFADSSNLWQHQRIHTRDKRYTCHICKNQFTCKSFLNVHMRTHTAEKPYTCDVCSQKFAHSSRLRIHRRIHTGDKRYTCNICDKWCTHTSHLIRHIRTHTGERPYSCDVCSKSFADSSALRQHQRIHTGDKRYTCSICDKRFTQKGNLIRHIRTHRTVTSHWQFAIVC